MKTIKDFFGIQQSSLSKRIKRKAETLEEEPLNNTNVEICASSPSVPQGSLMKMVVTPNVISSSRSQESISSLVPRSHSCQTYLDFGQASFGARRICTHCNMMIVNGHPEDEANHISICNSYRFGVSFQLKRQLLSPKCVHKLTTENALVHLDEWIVQVRASDSLHLRRKVSEVSAIVEEELGFLCEEPSMNNDTVGSRNKKNGVEAYSDDHIFGNGRQIFMYISNKRVVGFCSVEIISQAYPLMNEDIENNENKTNLSSTTKGIDRLNHQNLYTKSDNPKKAMIGVHQLWCHSNHRRKGIAKSMVDVVRREVIYGMIVPKNMIAFSSPTTDGALFAKLYCGTDSPLVYNFRC